MNIPIWALIIVNICIFGLGTACGLVIGFRTNLQNKKNEKTNATKIVNSIILDLNKLKRILE